MRQKLIEICFLIRTGIPAILARVLANISLLHGGGRLIVRNGMGGVSSDSTSRLSACPVRLK